MSVEGRDIYIYRPSVDRVSKYGLQSVEYLLSTKVSVDLYLFFLREELPKSRWNSESRLLESWRALVRVNKALEHRLTKGL